MQRFCTFPICHRVLATTKEQEKADAWVLRAHKCSDDADGDDGNSDGVDEHTSTTGEERPWVIVVHSKEVRKTI
jgi:hypothetical protein